MPHFPLLTTSSVYEHDGSNGPPPLRHVSLDEEVAIAIAILEAHSPTAAATRAAGSGGPLTPVTLAEASRLVREQGFDVGPFAIAAVADRLRDAQFIHQCGYAGSPPLGAAFWSFLLRTARQKRGDLFLTAALGWRFLVARIEPSVAMIVGRSKAGDLTCGSGLLLGGGVVVTNAHVLADAVPERVWLGETDYGIRDRQIDPGGTDVGLVRLADAPAARADLSIREPVVTEPVLVLGRPTVPQAEVQTMIAQTGEVCGSATQRGKPFSLVTTIVRPGNSGGPVFGRDGRVLGLVSRTFEREREAHDAGTPFPHFGCVPGGVVRDAVRRIDPAIDFPWEDYAQ